MSKNIKLKELLTERRLRDYDISPFDDSLKKLNKRTADLNKLWPQLQKTKAKTKWQKAKDIAYSLTSMGKLMYIQLERVRNTMDAPEYDDDE